MKNKKRTLHGAGYEKTRSITCDAAHLTAKSFFLMLNTRSMKNLLIIEGYEPLPLTDAQADFLHTILMPFAAKEILNELDLLSNIVLFDSKSPIDEKEKEALFTIKKV